MSKSKCKTYKNKRVTEILVAMIFMVTLCCLCIALTGCIDPKFEIRLYDDDWQEIKSNDFGNGYKWDYYEFEYDGTPKGFNAIAYKNGKEIYRTYKTAYYYNVLVLHITIDYNNNSGAYQLICPSGVGFLISQQCIR